MKEFLIRQPTGVDGKYKSAAEAVSSWTYGEHMLPKSVEEIMDLFCGGKSVLVFQQRMDELVGHAAITAVYDGFGIEIGSIIIPTIHRRKGIGGLATLAALELAQEKYPDLKPIAIANMMSGGLFQKLGATVLTTQEVDPRVWEFCNSCPHLPAPVSSQEFHCCDSPYDLSPITILFNQLEMALVDTMLDGTESLTTDKEYAVKKLMGLYEWEVDQNFK